MSMLAKQVIETSDMENMGSMDEFQIIKLIRDLADYHSPAPAEFPTDDDAAQLAHINQQAIISVDALEEGIHFPADAPPFLIGYRSVMVAVSDLAAMGAKPRGCFLSLSLPQHHSNEEFVKELAQGFALASSRVAMPLLGGNVIRGKSLGLSVTVVGDGKQVLGRRGAQVGDAIYVSGFLGDGAAGLKYASKLPHQLNQHQASLRAAYYCPPQRVSLGQRLHGLAKAAIDISDGLLNDLQHILEQNNSQNHAGKNLTAEILLNQLPYSQAILAETSDEERRDYALNGGDDYELLIIVAPEQQQKLEELSNLGDLCKLTYIGNIVACDATAGKIIGIEASGKSSPLLPKGYKHFS